jgi:hypothetical protein
VGKVFFCVKAVGAVRHIAQNYVELLATGDADKKDRINIVTPKRAKKLGAKLSEDGV